MKTSKSRLVLLGLFASSSAFVLVACQWVAGIHEHAATLEGGDATTPRDAQVVYVTPDGGDASLYFVDQCAHTTYPSPSDDASISTGTPPYVFAVSDIEFVPKTSLGYLGYDLDRVCTGFNKQTYDNGGSSCVDTMTVVDFTGGVDNSLGNTLDFLNTALVNLGGDVDTFTNVNDRIKQGKQTFLLVILDWDGSSNANDVRVESYLTDRLESNLCDGGVDLGDDGGDAGADDGDSGEPQPAPKFAGCDTWSVGWANFEPLSTSVDSPPQPIARSQTAWIVDDTLVAVYSAGIDVPFGLSSVHASEAIIQAKITRIDGGAAIQEGDGFIAGRVATSAMFTAFSAIPDPADKSHGVIHGFCPGSSAFSEAQSYICQAQDIAASSIEDFTGHPCDAISFASAFTSTTARLDPNPVDASVPEAGPGCVGTPIATCGDSGM